MVRTRSSSTKEDVISGNKKPLAQSQRITGMVTRSKAAKERGEIAVPKILYTYIQEALVLWEQLQANTSDEDLQSKYSDALSNIKGSAAIHKYTNNLPSDWSFHLDTARLCVPAKTPYLIPKKERKRKNKLPNPHNTNPLCVNPTVWLDFKIRNEADKVPALKGLPFPINKKIKNPLRTGDEFAHLICDYAVKVFNESYQMYVNKDNKQNISWTEILDCYYLKVGKEYFFYMTIKAAEQRRLGKYEISARCYDDIGDCSLTVDSFARLFPDMSAASRNLQAKMIKDGPPYNIPPGVGFENVKDGWMDPEFYYESSGMVRRRSVLGGYDYINPCGDDSWIC